MTFLLFSKERNTMPTIRIGLLSLVMFLHFTSGCTSFRTSILQRTASGTFVENYPRRITRGIPVKLKVPTHLEVVIEEDFFIQKTDSIPTKREILAAYRLAKPDLASKGDDELQQLLNNENENFKKEIAESATTSMFKEIPLLIDNQKIRSLNISTSVIYTDKVFTVDFKRPAAGLLNITDTTFDSEQYFKQINAKYTEETLKDINTAIGTLTGRGSSVKLGNMDRSIATDKREVARARFDISEPCWEEQLHGFVDHHATGCQLDCEYRN